MSTSPREALATPLRLGVVGAGPVGLSLALMAQARWPAATVTVYDSRATDARIADDARTLALSLGSVQAFEQLGVWPAIQPLSAPILAVHVSQRQPALLGLLRPRTPEPSLWLRASEQHVPMLGAVAPYGAIAMPLRTAWQQCCERAPERCIARFGTPVSGLTQKDGQVELDAGVVEQHDLVVIAEGGVFAEQSRKAVHHDYRQTAWVGEVHLQGGAAGVAFERFTTSGPLALLPLPGETGRAALVWCVDRADDPVPGLTAPQRVTVLNSLLPAAAGKVVSVSELKGFPLGLNAERTLVQGRCVRIGNAAQTLHPVAGQGLNLGLRDAHELVSRLSSAADLDATLRRLEWQRAPDRWGMIAATDFLARSFTWQWPGLTTLRGAGLGLLSRAPVLQRALSRQMMFGSRH
jgi:2-octaprenyl-6-methoxyphenol hydroxylase